MTAGFYATIVRGCGERQSKRKVGYLLGPYADEPTARAMIPDARRLAEACDPRTVFDAFGTARVELDGGDLPRGVLMDMLEKESKNAAR